MKFKIKKFMRIIFRIALYIFALIGLAFSGIFVAMKFHLTDVEGSIDSRNSFFNNIQNTDTRLQISQTQTYDWANSSEWQTLKEGLIKDQDLITEASKETGVPARLIASSVIPEQFRFFTSNRESFKKYFEPLKILGTYTQFSYGVSGIKMETAKKIEENLKDKNSDFYLGEGYENILDYDMTDNTVNNIDDKRLARFTDSHNHYYSYLYTALYLKEIMAQWSKKGFPVDNRPEVLATLFNLGFYRSVPKDNPEVGGATITIGGIDYTFGGLAYDFYYSNELSDIFPIDVQ